MGSGCSLGFREESQAFQRKSVAEAEIPMQPSRTFPSSTGRGPPRLDSAGACDTHSQCLSLLSDLNLCIAVFHIRISISTSKQRIFDSLTRLQNHQSFQQHQPVCPRLPITAIHVLIIIEIVIISIIMITSSSLSTSSSSSSSSSAS